MIYKSLSKSHLAAALESTRDIGEISARLPHKFQMFSNDAWRREQQTREISVAYWNRPTRWNDAKCGLSWCFGRIIEYKSGEERTPSANHDTAREKESPNWNYRKKKKVPWLFAGSFRAATESPPGKMATKREMNAVCSLLGIIHACTFLPETRCGWWKKRRGTNKQVERKKVGHLHQKETKYNFLTRLFRVRVSPVDYFYWSFRPPFFSSPSRPSTAQPFFYGRFANGALTSIFPKHKFFRKKKKKHPATGFIFLQKNSFRLRQAMRRITLGGNGVAWLKSESLRYSFHAVARRFTCDDKGYLIKKLPCVVVRTAAPEGDDQRRFSRSGRRRRRRRSSSLPRQDN